MQLAPKFQELQEPDAGFMLAALYYLLKNREACLEAVRVGKASGDTSDSALNLFYMAKKDTWRFQQGTTAP